MTAERFNELWLDTQRDMFGDSVTITDEYGSWWSYVPHFLHTPGYVYAYSFGELLVLALYRIYQEQGAAFVPKYIDLLAAGDSDYPDRLLARGRRRYQRPRLLAEGHRCDRGMDRAGGVAGA